MNISIVKNLMTFLSFFLLFTLGNLVIAESLENKVINIKKLENETLITIPQGKLQGEVKYSRDDRKFYSFRGIPYGKSKRFQESEPADNWIGIRDATKFGEFCLQFDSFQNSIKGAEDCLYLNVYTPKLNSNSTALLPVMVFIHGGGFNFGSGDVYGPKYFMDENVTLVTINYRLGPFGYFDTGLGTNIGMKDQVLSLKWIRDNINYFGGDSKAVTIFGESAGAGSVALHILSPMSKGLFHRAISESGTAQGPYLVPSDPKRETRKLGIILDCPTTNTKNLAECLLKMDGAYILQRLIDAKTGSIAGLRVDDIPIPCVTVDKYTARDGRIFLPDTPVNLLLKGEFERVPWIVGANSHEGLDVFITLYSNENERDRANQKWTEFAPETMRYEKTECKATTSIRQFYLGDNEIGTLDSLYNVTDAMSDNFFFYPTKVSAQLSAKYIPVYLYYFSLRGNATLDPRWRLLNITTEDGLIPAGHGDEIQYLFDTTYFPEIQPSSPFVEFSDRFIKLWVSFAKNGITPVNWTPVPSANNQTEWYHIDSTEWKMANESNIFGDRLKLWYSILPLM